MALAYFAVPISGGVLHTVNIRYSPELIFYTMQHANDRFVIIRDEFVPLGSAPPPTVTLSLSFLRTSVAPGLVISM